MISHMHRVQIEAEINRVFGSEFEQIAPGTFLSVSHNVKAAPESREELVDYIETGIKAGLMEFISTMRASGFTVPEATAIVGRAHGAIFGNMHKLLEQHRDTCTSDTCSYTSGPLTRDFDAYMSGFNQTYLASLAEWAKEKAEAKALAESWMNKEKNSGRE